MTLIALPPFDASRPTCRLWTPERFRLAGAGPPNHPVNDWIVAPGINRDNEPNHQKGGSEPLITQ
jgi:hypothetical protein